MKTLIALFLLTVSVNIFAERLVETQQQQNYDSNAGISDTLN